MFGRTEVIIIGWEDDRVRVWDGSTNLFLTRKEWEVLNKEVEKRVFVLERRDEDERKRTD